MQADLQTGLKPCLTFYPTYDWELAFHIYREREFTAPTSYPGSILGERRVKSVYTRLQQTKNR